MMSVFYLVAAAYSVFANNTSFNSYILNQPGDRSTVLTNHYNESLMQEPIIRSMIDPPIERLSLTRSLPTTTIIDNSIINTQEMWDCQIPDSVITFNGAQIKPSPILYPG